MRDIDRLDTSDPADPPDPAAAVVAGPTDHVRLSDRRPGPDVTRALAMAGVIVMNYHGYLVLRGARSEGGSLYDVFDPWTGPLSTRFAATFVLVAGIGVTLMTRSAAGDPVRTRQMRWRLVRRGAVLYAFGLLFDQMWRGTILPYYGVMFVIAAALFTWRSRWVLLFGAGAALAGWAIRAWRYEAELDGVDTTWLTAPVEFSPQGLVFDVFVNGTHPLLPWLAFLCAGIVVGRMLTLPWWRPAVMATGFALFTASSLTNSTASSERARVLLAVDPFERGLVYVASALGTALIAFGAISWIADRWVTSPVIDGLRRAGQLSLTLYVAHAFVFELLVDQLDVVRPAGIATALTFAAAYWFAATAAAIAYQHRFGRGPIETIYRQITG